MFLAFLMSSTHNHPLKAHSLADTELVASTTGDVNANIELPKLEHYM